MLSALALLLVLAYAWAPRELVAQAGRPRIEVAGPVEKDPGVQAGEGQLPSVRETALVIKPEDLTGEKRAKSAHILLKAIHTGEESLAERHRRFLVRTLSGEALRAGEVPWISAMSIVQELQSWIPREGLPYPEIAGDVLPLVGVGDLEFRSVVIQTVNVLVTYEMERGRSSPSLAALEARLVQRAPSESFLRDATAVLWKNDPRAALASLVGALDVYSGGRDADESMLWACLDELKTRVSIYFPTTERWQNWWKSVQDLPLEEILVDYQKRSVSDYTANWRRLMDRLRETQDAERVLSAIRDTLQRNSVELRLAAVNALGAYVQWLFEIPLRPEQSQDWKTPFLKRGAEALLGVIERESFPLESPEVIQAALASLRMYQNLLETAPEVHRRLAENVLFRLRKFSREDCPESGIYLETVRVAGALEVTGALPHIETYLKKAGARKNAGLEFLSSAIITLGRLVDGAGMSEEMAELLIRFFEEPRAGAPGASGKDVQDLRLVCMIALERGANNPAIRKRLLEFYKRALVEHQDAVLSVRAILGLGTLVKAKEADALQTMVEILENKDQDEYSLDAVLAVVDSIASYVSPPEALRRFLPILVTPEAAIRDRLRSKVLGLVEAGGLANAALVSRELLTLGIEKENPLYFEAAERLFAEAPLKALLDPQKLDLASQSQVSLWLSTVIHLARIHDLLRQNGGGAEEDLAGLKMSSLRELLLQNEVLRKQHADGVAEVEAMAAAFQKRRELLSRVTPERGDPAPVIQGFGELLAVEPSPAGRLSHLLWIERQLAAIKSAERLESLRDACIAYLGAEPNAGVWYGLPAAFRARYMGRLKDLQAASPPAPPASGSPDKKEAEKES